MNLILLFPDKGELYTWGWNSDGQLGLDDTEDRTTPTVIPMEHKTKLIACGRVNSLCYTGEYSNSICQLQ